MMSKKDPVGLDPFAAALADSISGRTPPPDFEDAVEGELDALLFDDESDEDVLQLLADGVIGVDPYTGS